MTDNTVFSPKVFHRQLPQRCHRARHGGRAGGLFFVAACMGLIASAPRGVAQSLISSNWIGASGTGGPGNWSTAADWSPALVPNNAINTYNVFIDNGLAANSAVTLDTSVTIDNLMISSGDSLTLANSQRLTVAGNGTTGTISGAGTLNMGSTGNITDLVITAGTVTLSNTGGI